MGDIIICTRFYSQADNLVPLPSELMNMSRISLVSIAYRLTKNSSICRRNANGKATDRQEIRVLRVWITDELNVTGSSGTRRR